MEYRKEMNQVKQESQGFLWNLLGFPVFWFALVLIVSPVECKVYDSQVEDEAIQ